MLKSILDYVDFDGGNEVGDDPFYSDLEGIIIFCISLGNRKNTSAFWDSWAGVMFFKVLKQRVQSRVTINAKMPEQFHTIFY